MLHQHLRGGTGAVPRRQAFRSCPHTHTSGRARPIRAADTLDTLNNQPQVIHQAQSQYNMVLVVEVPPNVGIPELAQLAGSRIMQLDHTGNIHSLWHPMVKPTGGYWDVLATLPGIAAPGPIAILGLGAGTLPRLIDHLFPGQVMHGWELDPAVVMAGRTFMGMDELEAKGVLVTHTGDALSEDAQQGCPEFPTMVVDLFQGGALLPELSETSTWKRLKARVAETPGSRIMINLGHAPLTADIEQLMNTSMESRLQRYRTLQALEAMQSVFGAGQVSVLIYRNLEDNQENSNCVAVTGSCEGMQERWEASLPPMLSHLKAQCTWQTCEDVLKVAS